MPDDSNKEGKGLMGISAVISAQVRFYKLLLYWRWPKNWPKCIPNKLILRKLNLRTHYRADSH